MKDLLAHIVVIAAIAVTPLLIFKSIQYIVRDADNTRIVEDGMRAYERAKALGLLDPQNK